MVSPLAAQSFSRLAELVDSIRQFSPYSSSAQKGQERSMQMQNVETFTERARKPDLSSGYDKLKYYYIRNVATGEYLHYSGTKQPSGAPEAVPLTTVKTPSKGSEFFLYRAGVVLGDGYGLCNSVSSTNYQLGNLESNTWTSTGTNAPLINVKTSDNLAALNIYFTQKENEVNVNQYWRYNPETGVVEYGETDEYAQWVFEAIVETPQVTASAEQVDAFWYVVKNTGTGKYLHYNQDLAQMETVTAPDSCSLICFLGDSLNAPLNLYNYVAKSSLVNNLRVVQTEGKRYFISQSGDVSSSDIYMLDGDGNVTIGAYGTTSEWEFERVINFKEIFGLQSGDAEKFNQLMLEFERISSLDKVSLYNYYSVYVGVLGYTALGLSSSLSLKDAAKLAQNRVILDEMFENYDPNSHEEISICNIGHLDSEGNVIRRNLATNSQSLIANDKEYIHTNIWEVILVGEGAEKFPVVYNTVTKMYLTAPKVDGEGNATVGMTPSLFEAGGWFFVGDDESLFNNLSNKLIVESMLTSLDEPDYYLVLDSPTDVAVSCRYLENVDSIFYPGSMWEIGFNEAHIDESLYLHAANTADEFVGLIQSQMGLVKNGCERYSSNFPSDDEESSTCYLTDGNSLTVFWTNGTGSDEKRYLLADLGEQNQVQDFHFYMKPNFSTLNGIPANITVEGSNSPEGGFEVLAEDVELTMLLENMYYMSSLITTGGNTYRYLRFTVNEVRGNVDARDFTLSEFYLLPNNAYTAQAKQLVDAFYACGYLSEEIIYPATELVKMKASYLLEQNVSNHSESPGIGQYPTLTYVALAEAVQNVQSNDADSMDRLVEALDDFINSIVNPILIIESAWEDGYTAGSAVSFENGGVAVRTSNRWDLRQWMTLKTQNNGYMIQPLTWPQEVPYLLNIDKIDGWNNLYDSKQDAYTVSMVEGGYRVYLSINEGGYVDYAFEPATIAHNKHAAWYFTSVGSSAGVNTVDNAEFVEILADFGATFAVAQTYEEGYLNGTYIYNEEGGLTKAGFDELYTFMLPYYQMGPLTVVQMYQSGSLPENALAYVAEAVRALKFHFPNFIKNISMDGYYYRLKGNESGRYLLSDIAGDGSLGMGTLSEDDHVTAMKSIFYTSKGSANGALNVMAFDSGRYLKSEAGRFEYDQYPLDDATYYSQDVLINSSLSGAEGCYSIAMGGNAYLGDASERAVAVSGLGELPVDWQVELVYELPISISSAMMTSLCVPVELQVPDGVTVYMLTGKEVANGNHKHVVDNEVCEPGAPVFNIEALRLDFIPAGVPVLLKAAEGVYYFPINYNATEEGKTDAELQRIEEIKMLNKLEGTHDARLLSARANVTHHILSKKNGKVGMYKVKMVSAAERGLDYILVSTFLNSAHRAWLPYQSDMAPVGFSLAIGGRGDGLTGIEDVQVKFNGNEVIYDIHGRRVSRMVSPGLYIVNREKVLVK